MDTNGEVTEAAPVVEKPVAETEGISIFLPLSSRGYQI